MVDKEDLGLSLSLSFPQDAHRPLQLNLMPSLLPASSSSPSPSPFALQKPSWHDAFPSSGMFFFLVLVSLMVEFLDLHVFCLFWRGFRSGPVLVLRKNGEKRTYL